MARDTFSPENGYDKHLLNAGITNLGHSWSILAGYDERGYAIRLQKNRDEREPMVRAGCQYMTLKEARRHWVSAGRNYAPSVRRTSAQVLALIGIAVATAKAKGWIKSSVRFNTTPRKISR